MSSAGIRKLGGRAARHVASAGRSANAAATAATPAATSSSASGSSGGAKLRRRSVSKSQRQNDMLKQQSVVAQMVLPSTTPDAPAATDRHTLYAALSAWANGGASKPAPVAPPALAVASAAAVAAQSSAAAPSSSSSSSSSRRSSPSSSPSPSAADLLIEFLAVPPRISRMMAEEQPAAATPAAAAAIQAEKKKVMQLQATYTLRQLLTRVAADVAAPAAPSSSSATGVAPELAPLSWDSWLSVLQTIQKMNTTEFHAMAQGVLDTMRMQQEHAIQAARAAHTIAAGDAAAAAAEPLAVPPSLRMPASVVSLAMQSIAKANGRTLGASVVQSLLGEMVATEERFELALPVFKTVLRALIAVPKPDFARIQSFYDALQSHRDASTTLIVLHALVRHGQDAQAELLVDDIAKDTRDEAKNLAAVFGYLLAVIQRDSAKTVAAAPSGGSGKVGKPSKTSALDPQRALLLDRSERLWIRATAIDGLRLSADSTLAMLKIRLALDGSSPAGLVAIQKILAQAVKLEELAARRGRKIDGGGGAPLFADAACFQVLFAAFSASAAPQELLPAGRAALFQLHARHFEARSLRQVVRASLIGSLSLARQSFVRFAHAAGDRSVTQRNLASTMDRALASRRRALASKARAVAAANVIALAKKQLKALGARPAKKATMPAPATSAQTDATVQRIRDMPRFKHEDCKQLIDKLLAKLDANKEPTLDPFMSIFRACMKDGSTEQLARMDSLYASMQKTRVPGGRALRIHPHDFSHLIHLAHQYDLITQVTKWTKRARLAGAWKKLDREAQYIALRTHLIKQSQQSKEQAKQQAAATASTPPAAAAAVAS